MHMKQLSTGTLVRFKNTRQFMYVYPLYTQLAPEKLTIGPSVVMTVINTDTRCGEVELTLTIGDKTYELWVEVSGLVLDTPAGSAGTVH